MLSTPLLVAFVTHLEIVMIFKNILMHQSSHDSDLLNLIYTQRLSYLW